MQKFLGVLTLCLSLSSCTPIPRGGEPSYQISTFPLKRGSYNNGKYIDAKGLYSFQMPQMGPGMVVDENDLPHLNKTSVSIRDDFGLLYSVEVVSLPADILERLQNEPDEMKFLKMFFRFGYVESLLPYFPGTEIVEEQILDSDVSEKTLLALVKIPQGNNMMNADTGVHLDSKRAYAIFNHGKYTIILSVQESALGYSLKSILKDPDGTREAEANKTLYKKLIEFRKSFEMND